MSPYVSATNAMCIVYVQHIYIYVCACTLYTVQVSPINISSALSILLSCMYLMLHVQLMRAVHNSNQIEFKFYSLTVRHMLCLRHACAWIQVSHGGLHLHPWMCPIMPEPRTMTVEQCFKSPTCFVLGSNSVTRWVNDKAQSPNHLFYWLNPNDSINFVIPWVESQVTHLLLSQCIIWLLNTYMSQVSVPKSEGLVKIYKSIM